jgi:hypothetical protein
VAATAEVAGEEVGETRKHLSAALDRGEEIHGRVRERAVGRKQERRNYATKH